MTSELKNHDLKIKKSDFLFKSEFFYINQIFYFFKFVFS